MLVYGAAKYFEQYIHMILFNKDNQKKLKPYYPQNY